MFIDARGTNDGSCGCLFHRYRIVRISAELDHPNSNDSYPQEAQKSVFVRPFDNGLYRSLWIAYISHRLNVYMSWCRFDYRFFIFFSCVFACPVVQRPGLLVNDKSLLRNGAGIWWRNSLPALPQREACRKESKGYIKQECAGLTRLCQLTATQTHVILQNILTQTQFHNVKQSYQNGLVARWKAYRKRLSGK